MRLIEIADPAPVLLARVEKFVQEESASFGQVVWVAFSMLQTAMDEIDPGDKEIVRRAMAAQIWESLR